MPASSRKRNKGKERKAKKAAEKEESALVELQQTWRWARGNMGSSGDTGIYPLCIQCKHGLGEVVLPDGSHPISKFISSYLLLGTTLKDTISNNQDVWNDASVRKMTADILTRIGTNLLCVPGTSMNQSRDSQHLIIDMAFIITMLENYDKALDYDSNAVKPSYKYLYCGSNNAYRDLLKFYRKRLKCSCLKKIHLEARKTHPKLGKCHSCGVIKERSLLMVCSRCMVAPYCSRECQVLDSPRHREYCDILVRAEQIVANEVLDE